MKNEKQSLLPIQSAQTGLPIACKLSEAARATRGDEVSDLFGASEGVSEIEDGYALRFPVSEEMVGKLTAFVLFERVCCPFLTFELAFEPGEGPLWLR